LKSVILGSVFDHFAEELQGCETALIMFDKAVSMAKEEGKTSPYGAPLMKKS
jgi:hypothetical protein